MKKNAIPKGIYFIDYDVIDFSTLLIIGLKPDKIIDYITNRTTTVLNDEEIGAINDIKHQTGKSIILFRGQTILWLRRKPNDAFMIGTLAHEAQHVSDFIMTRIGMRYTEDSDEIYAYLTGYIVRRALVLTKLNGNH